MLFIYFLKEEENFWTYRLAEVHHALVKIDSAL